VLAFEARRDGFWLVRWLRARGIEAYVIHPASIVAWFEYFKHSQRATVFPT
jgi:transposase